MSNILLDMDIERLIDIILFFLFLFLFMKVLLVLTKTTKSYFIRYLSQALLICTIIVLLMEIIIRFSYSIYYREINFLVYPLRSFTRDYISINWTPQFYMKENGSLIDNTSVITKDYQGLNYFRATQNHLGFRYDPTYNKKQTNIVALGGSSTWGHNSDGQTYPDYLEDFLGEERFNVFNLGKRGHTTGHFINNLKKSGLSDQIKVDIAILYCGHNDSLSHHNIFPAYDILRATSFYHIQEFSFIKYSLLARNLYVFLFSSTAEKIINKQLFKKIDFAPNSSKKSLQSFESSVINTIEYLRSQNDKIKVLLVPEYTNYYVSFIDFKNSINNQDYKESSKLEIYKIINYDFFLKYKSLQKIAKQFPDNTHFVSIDFFASYPPKQLLMDTVHLTSKGNKILAQNIAKHIQLLSTNSLVE